MIPVEVVPGEVGGDIGARLGVVGVGRPRDDVVDEPHRGLDDAPVQAQLLLTRPLGVRGLPCNTESPFFILQHAMIAAYGLCLRG